jgi:GT2 family glycosyltransferase
VQLSVGVVIVTRDRRDELVATLAGVERSWGRHLGALQPVAPAVPFVVVDNGSTDGTVEALESRFPWCRVLLAGTNRGAAGRTDGAAVLDTDLVAFADDDSWWPPTELARAAAHFAAHPRMGLLAARVLVGPGEVEDPVCADMAASPYTAPPGVELPGPAVLGFVACGAMVRRRPFLDVGGFHPRYGIGGEEALLALDLAAAGWGCAYVADVVVHHHPSASRDPRRRRAVMVRNDVWTAMLRRPLPIVAAELESVAAAALEDEAVAAGLEEALAAADELWSQRRALPDWLERQLT